MPPASWAAVAVAIISALGAWAASKSAKNASVSSEKAKAETEAYERARKMDVETIERQSKELAELRQRDEARELAMRKLRESYEELHNENVALKRRVAILERQQGDLS